MIADGLTTRFKYTNVAKEDYGLTNEEMSGFREEMVKVIEKYFVIDKEGFDVKYHRIEDHTTSGNEQTCTTGLPLPSFV